LSLSPSYVGYAIGSLIGGFLYHEVGGRVALIIFCAISFVCCVMHFVLYEYSLKHTMLPTGKFLQFNICWEQLYLENCLWLSLPCYMLQDAAVNQNTSLHLMQLRQYKWLQVLR